MLAERAVTIAYDLLNEINAFGLVDLLHRAANLAARRPQLSDSQYANESRQLRTEAQSLLAKSKFNDYPLEFLKLINSSELNSATPQSVARLIIGGFPENKTGAINSAEISLITNEVIRLIGHINGFLMFAKAIGVKPIQIPDGIAALELLLPWTLIERNISIFADKITEFDEFIAAVTEYATGTRTHPELQYLATSDPIATLKVTGTAAAAIIALYVSLLTAAEKTVSLYKAINDLKVGGVDPTAVNTAVDAMKKAIESTVKSEIDAALKRCVPADSGARKNEIENEIRIKAPKITLDIARGARLYLSAPSAEQFAILAGSTAAPDKSAVSALVQEQKTIEAKLDALTVQSPIQIVEYSPRE